MDQRVVSGSGPRLGNLRVWAEPTDPDRPPQLLWQLVNAQKPEWLLAQAPISDAADVRVGARPMSTPSEWRWRVRIVGKPVSMDHPESRPSVFMLDSPFTIPAEG